MYGLKTIVNWGWSSILITVLAVVAFIYEWPINVVVPVLIFILVIGLVVAVTRFRDREMGRSSLRLRQMAGYFNRRFMGTSSLSIFAIIDSLFKIDDPKLWNWARACDMSQRIFNSWCDSFISWSRQINHFRPVLRSLKCKVVPYETAKFAVKKRLCWAMANIAPIIVIRRLTAFVKR